ncbi:single-stranded DNA-binding protein [Flavobacterium sp. GSP11]
MEITGRVTADAVVHKVGNDRQVVNFSIAINDNYKPKGSTEVKEIVTYINCSYWLSAKVAEWLKKGALVQLFGRIGLNVYSNSEGKAFGSLTFHTNNIKILIFAKKSEQAENITAHPAVRGTTSETADDLPF